MPKKSKSIIVTVSDDAMADIQRVADQLKEKGMKVDRVMPNAGVITGSTPATKVARLSQVRGVMNVEEEAVAELPPPGESPQ